MLKIITFFCLALVSLPSFSISNNDMNDKPITFVTSHVSHPKVDIYKSIFTEVYNGLGYKVEFTLYLHRGDFYY